MKFLHLSDLHIGKRVNEVSMLDDQAYILKQLLQLIDEEAPQAVIIAGDVYDKSVPSAEAVALFDEFLYSLSQRDTQVMIISGNHDSPERLSFGGRLMGGSGIHLSPVYNGSVEPVRLRDEYGSVDFWLLPFIKPVHVRRFYPDEVMESYTDACRVAIAHMPIQKEHRNVLVTHQFVTGAATCESEELSVGGSDNVDASVFDSFDYVALGHIHGPQNIGSNRIRYCGTPLKYSLSEAEHFKSVTVVELEDKQVQLRTLPLRPMRDLRQLRGTFEELTDPAFWENTATEDYVYITLTDEEDVPEAAGRLRAIYPHCLAIRYDNTRTRCDQLIDSAQAVAEKTTLELFEELYEKQNNQPMTDEQRRFTAELIESIEEVQL